jgi:hypothetical protein
MLTKKFNGRLDLVLASYNAGEGAVDCYLNGRTLRDSSNGKVINPRGIKTGGIPPYNETISYVKRGVLVFSRLTSAGVFPAELVAQTRALQSPPLNIAVATQRLIDNELSELGGMPATMLFANSNGSVDPGLAGNASIITPQSKVDSTQTVARNDANRDKPAGETFETVFFDVHSGTRYLVREGKIVKPIEATPEDAPDSAEAAIPALAVNGEAAHKVTKSFYMGTGGGE